MQGVSRFRQYNGLSSVGNGYVIIPSNIERDDYVVNCYRKERVTLLGDNGMGVLLDCYISKEALDKIVFPKDTDSLGSYVTFVVNSFNNFPIIIGIISKEEETQLLEEGEFCFEKIFGNSRVNITGKAKSGELTIDVINEDNKGSFVLNVKGKEGSDIKINCAGKTTIFSEDELNLETSNEINVKSFNKEDVDDFSLLKINKDGINITPSEDGIFKVVSGSEAILLGNKTVDQLNKITERINGIVAAIKDPSAAASFKDGGIAIKASLLSNFDILEEEDYSEVKSEISFTD